MLERLKFPFSVAAGIGRRCAAAGSLALLAAAAALAQDAPEPAPYPHDVVTLITHSSPGGGSDVFLRELARQLEPLMGVNFVIEHVRGGGGSARDGTGRELTGGRQRVLRGDTQLRFDVVC